jgi:hypothetical protein
MKEIKMDLEMIRQMVENGFANKRIATKLQIVEKELKQIIRDNQWSMLYEDFDSSKIEYICQLYAEGVSAKALGVKFSIDKRRVQKWVKELGILRCKNDAHRFTEFNQHIFDTIDTEEKAYWLGFFYADAYNCDITNTFSISLQDEDYNHLVKLCNFVGLPVSKISRYMSNIDNKQYPTCCIRLYSKHICSKMTELGCPRAKSFLIEYPGFLLPEFDKHFIRGMFDGDGCLTYRENQKEWKWSLASTENCCESIQRILLDNTSLIINYRNISKTNHNTCELETGGNEKIGKLLNWLYIGVHSDIFLERKHQKFLDLVKHQGNRYTTSNQRMVYKINEEDKNDILKEVALGKKFSIISNDYHIHPSTIKRFVKEEKIEQTKPFDQIVSINGHLITTKYVKTLDYIEREALIEPLFQHFRKQGWLYPTDTAKVDKEYGKLCSWQPDLSSNSLFNNSSLATNICKFFCHLFYEATESDKPTMLEVFNDDDKLRLLIRNRLGFDWWDKEDNDETFNISFRMLIQGMRSSRLVPAISIFKPNIAKHMYMKYSQEGDTVFDYSAGWGGRMLGAAASGRKYVGIDPLTIDELGQMRDYLQLPNITLIKDGSENVKLGENSVDFSFSSPPYFNQEYYSSDKSQAYNNGNDYFYNIYWKRTLENSRFMLKPGKWFGLNIINYPQMLSMAQEVFGNVIETVNLRTVRNHLTKTAGIEKFEPIYLFRNNK